MTVDPLYWRDQALQKRIMASRMKDPLAQAAMIRLASHYAELAKRTEGSIQVQLLNGFAFIPLPRRPIGAGFNQRSATIGGGDPIRYAARRRESGPSSSGSWTLS